MKLSIAVLLFSLTAPLAAQAQVINIPNFSFETATNNNYSSVSPNLISNFVESGGEYYGVGNNNGFSPNAFVGGQHAFINLNNGAGASATLTTAAAVTTFAANTTYTLTVALGDSAQPDNTGYGSPGNQFFSFLANNVVVETFNLSNFTLSDGSSQDYSLSLDTANPLYTALATAGEAMTLQVGSTQADGTPVQAEFDNIRLTAASDVPEPSTWMLLIASVGALIVLGRRVAQLS